MSSYCLSTNLRWGAEALLCKRERKTRAAADMYAAPGGCLLRGEGPGGSRTGQGVAPFELGRRKCPSVDQERIDMSTLLGERLAQDHRSSIRRRAQARVRCAIPHDVPSDEAARRRLAELCRIAGGVGCPGGKSER